MSTPDPYDDAALERLSALVDGELDDSATGRTCDAWRGGAELRASWHSYHLIGDVLRSEDLASDPARDSEFLRSLRARMASEPVVFAPAASLRRRLVGGTLDDVPPQRVARNGWRVPSAIAAGLVMVVGVFGVVRLTTPTDTSRPGVALALSAPAPDASARSDIGAGAGSPRTVLASNQLIRDARLDRYLEAHKQFAGSSMLGVPSAFLHSATFDSTTR